MRATAWFLAALTAACHPSATVEHTMPVANLQTYRTIALRVQSAYASADQSAYLEQEVLQTLHQWCGFEQIARVGTTPADVVLDLNITRMARGGSGWMKNPSLATIETLLVLSDGQSGELLGTARIYGKSSGMIINNSVPEREAIDVVAKSVASVLTKSGCSGPRVARVEPPPPPPPPDPGANQGSAAPPPPDETHRPEAEALNEQGKEKLRGADLAGALADFQHANALVPDARYEFNVCLTFETQEQWDKAIAACREARGMNPQAKLLTKIDHRLDLLQHRQ